MFKNIVFIVFLILIVNPSYSLDYDGFSEHSVIENTINKNYSITDEQKEGFVARKLQPSVKCLNEEIKKGNIENVEFLLKAKIDPNGNYITEYPVLVAARYNKAEIVKLLIEYGAKLDRGFYSELYEAIKNKNKELAEYLINNNAKINYQDVLTNNTVLYLSLKNKMYDTSRLLILKGAKADVKSIRYIQKHKLQNLIETENSK